MRNPGGFDYPAYLARRGIFLVGSGRAERLRPLSPEDPPWAAALGSGSTRFAGEVLRVSEVSGRLPTPVGSLRTPQKTPESPPEMQ
ncbi:MAG: hypothetical protein ACE5FK_03025 [Candidatus Methylomirabilia bacterium]